MEQRGLVSSAMSNSINQVFGRNLRQLCALRPSIAHVARELGLGKVQFHRLLNAESFPKPNELKRICEYFGVDARIVTDPLEPAQMKSLSSGQRLGEAFSQAGKGLHPAFSYAYPDFQDYTDAPDFPDGFYQIWRHSLSQPGKVVLILIHVRTVGGAKVVRGLEPRSKDSFGFVLPTKSREYRGLILRQMTGYTILYFHRGHEGMVTTVFLEPFESMGNKFFVGINVLCRSVHPMLRRLARTAYCPVPNKLSAVLKAARQQKLWEIKDLPPLIRATLDLPLDAGLRIDQSG